MCVATPACLCEVASALAALQQHLPTLLSACFCRAAPPAGLKPLCASLVALHTSACHAMHALLACSADALCRSMLDALPGHGGSLDANAAAHLISTLLTVNTALQTALHTGQLQSGPADRDEESAAQRDRWGGWQGVMPFAGGRCMCMAWHDCQAVGMCFARVDLCLRAPSTAIALPLPNTTGPMPTAC